MQGANHVYENLRKIRARASRARHALILPLSKTQYTSVRSNMLNLRADWTVSRKYSCALSMVLFPLAAAKSRTL